MGLTKLFGLGELMMVFMVITMKTFMDITGLLHCYYRVITL